MWIITLFNGTEVTMFEYQTEKEAREAMKKMKGQTILSEVGCFAAPAIKPNQAA